MRDAKSNHESSQGGIPIILPDPSDIDPAWLASELSIAESTLRNVYEQTKNQVGNDQRHIPKFRNAGPNAQESSLVQDLSRLKILEAKVEFLNAANDFATWEEVLATNGWCKGVNEVSIINPLQLGKLASMLKRLITSNSNVPISPANNVNDLRVIMWNRYQFLYLTSLDRVTKQIQSFLRVQGYPKNEECSKQLQTELRSFLEQTKKSESIFGSRDCNHNVNDLKSCSIYLMHLYVIHLSTSTISESIFRLSNGSIEECLPSSLRIPIIGEFGRPIIERIMYHFSLKNNNENKREDKDDEYNGKIENKILVEHLLSYTQENIEATLILIHQSLYPCLKYVIAEHTRILLHGQDITHENEECMARSPDLVNYFLTEVVYAVYRLIEDRLVFKDKKLLENSSLYIHALNQILSFDEFIMKCSSEYESEKENAIISRPPRLIDLFLNSSPLFLQTLVSMEWKGASFLLSSASLSSKITKTQEEMKQESSLKNLSHLIFLSPETEVFLSFYESIKRKLMVVTQKNARKAFVTKILLPLSMQLLEQLHGKAKLLLKKLDEWGNKKPKEESLGKVDGLTNIDVERKFRSKMNENDNLKYIIHEWCDIFTGTNLVIHTLMDPNLDSFEDHLNDLNRSGKSLQGLLEAMIEECSSHLVERMMMEKAKMAMYLMQCPHLLSLSSHGSQNISNSAPSLSSDLVEAVRVLSIILEGCREKSNHIPSISCFKVENEEKYSMMRKMLAFGPDTIQSSLSLKISKKLVEIVLDELQVYEIRFKGSCQFRHDVEEIINLFQNYFHGKRDLQLQYDFTSFHRIHNLSKFITMEWKQFVSIKEAMYGLCQDKFSSYDNVRNDHNGVVEETVRYLSAHDLESDFTIMHQAKTMLAAKGMDWLEISDAVLVLNRRLE